MDTVYLVNQFNAHLYQADLLAQQYRLRKRVCLDWRGWQGHSVWEGGEFDEFDNPAANYFIWLDETGTARGMMRLVPTTLPYMQKQLWPHMVDGQPFPTADNVWEVSRVCFEAPVLGLGRDLRRVMQLVMMGISEWGAITGVDDVWWMTYTKFAAICPGKHNINWLGDESLIDGERCRAGWSSVPSLVPQSQRKRFQITGPVLQWADRPGELVEKAA